MTENFGTIGVYRFEVGWMFRIAFTPIINPRIMPIFTAQGYAPISVKTIAHYGQIINNKGNFTQYDYGMLGNLKRYHSQEPPKYNLEDIPVNVTLIYGNKDKLAYKTDVEDLYSNLHPNRRSIIEIPRNGTSESWAHLDFVIGVNIKTVMYPEIDDVLDKMK
ncbi:unnamed protein product [Brassicogethes aeneus]|uniref:Uncharacterized protein n=1 Tax=Brassicogethes aeneus TaxID=1431903 RepID=A0A9P0B845_BRAAE|nr:unnamed protein product [Brassicogethes aeneus]